MYIRLISFHPVCVRRALYQNYQSAGGGAAASPLGRRLSRQSSGGGDGNKQQQDLVKTANLLFGALEPHYVWDYMKVSPPTPAISHSMALRTLIAS